MTLQDIDTDFSFTQDTPEYWDDFWKKDSLRGGSSKDPDSYSPTLKEYHRLLWSKPLPNGRNFVLEDGRSWSYLKTRGTSRDGDRAYGSDSMMVSFRQRIKAEILREVEASVPDYKAFIKSFVDHTYTIGGMIIFPQIQWSMNQARGCHSLICDRWDLTLECIRMYYADGLTLDNPLYKSLAKERNREFFDAFVDFKGYVDFFLLQDCVSLDYSQVKLWYGSSPFESNPMPKTVDGYLSWLKSQRDFVDCRNRRISEFCKSV